MANPRFAFGPFLLDAGSGTLLEDGLPVALGSKELALLRALVEAQGQVVTKSALMDAAWPDVSVEESSLSVQIAALRKRLRVSANDEDWIVTFPRVGYRFAGPIRIDEQDASNIQPRPAIESKPSKPVAIVPAGSTIHQKKKRLPAWQLAIGALLIALAAGAVGWLRPGETRTEPASVERMALPLPDRPSIVVLPFANVSGDASQGFFADGITDDLITELSKVSSLFVIARNTSFTYKGQPTKIARVAEELGIRYVLEGSVQRAGDRVRINTQLIDALDGGNVWADRFDGSIGDIFSLQDKVTSSAADALAVRLTSSQQEAIAQRETNSPAAYDAFLRGWEHYRRTTPGDYAKAIPFFEEAIKLDPSYHRAYAALAMVYIVSYARDWLGSLGITDGEARIRAQQNLRIARQQPTALAHQAAGYAYLERGASMDAFAEFKQATGLDPSDSWSYAFAALALTTANRPEEALPYVKMAMRLEPRPPALFVYYQGLAEFNLERFEEAALSFEKAGRLNPDDQFPFLVLAATYGHLGRTDDATAAVARYNELTVKQGGIPASEDGGWSDCTAISGIVIERVMTGLRSAGLPKSLARGEFAERNRLSPEEVRSLLFGHRLHGRPFRQTSENRSGSVTMEGSAAFSGDWVAAGVPQENGRINFRNNELCITFGPTNYCGIVLRNPGASKASENEFIWRGYPFSQVE